MSTATPLHDRALVKIISADSKKSEILILPDYVEAQLKKGKASLPYKGVVRKVGEGRIMADGSTRPMGVKPGDVIIFDFYAGQDRVKEADEELAIVNELDIKVVL